jgi:hypothetical protein
MVKFIRLRVRDSPRSTRYPEPLCQLQVLPDRCVVSCEVSVNLCIYNPLLRQALRRGCPHSFISFHIQSTNSSVRASSTRKCSISALHQRELPLLHRSYWLMRQTKTLLLSSVVPITVGLRRLLSAPAGKWPFPTLSLQSLYRCLDPYPVAFLWCICSFLPKEQRPHHRGNKFGLLNAPCIATSTGNSFSRLQSFLYVQAPILDRPPGCTHR